MEIYEETGKTMRFLLLIIFSISISCSSFEMNKASNKANHLEVRHKELEEIYQTLDKRARLFSLDVLREDKLSKEDDVEVRIWTSQSIIKGLSGAVLKKVKDEWTAFYLPNDSKLKGKINPVKLAAPKSGWEKLWKELEDENILTLPDETDVHEPMKYEEGQSVIIETKSHGLYRIYKYTEPLVSDLEQAKNVSNIIRITEHEFNIPLYIYSL